MTNQDAEQLERIVSEMTDEQKRSLIDRLTESLSGDRNGSQTRNGSDHDNAPSEEDPWLRFVERTRAATAHLPAGHQVDDSRESIYEGRGE
jgi:hypothetical protein